MWQDFDGNSRRNWLTPSEPWYEFDRASLLIHGNEMSTRCNRWFFIAKLIVCSTCFGHHYAHHQDLKSIIQVVAACGTWCFWFSSCRSGVELWVVCSVCGMLQHLEVLMMGIMVPETCWANNKFCNKEPSVASSWHSISTYPSKPIWQTFSWPRNFQLYMKPRTLYCVHKALQFSIFWAKFTSSHTISVPYIVILFFHLRLDLPTLY